MAPPVLPTLQASFWCFGTCCVNKRALWQVQASAWLLDVDQMESRISRNAKCYIPERGHSSSSKLSSREKKETFPACPVKKHLVLKNEEFHMEMQSVHVFSGSRQVIL